MEIELIRDMYNAIITIMLVGTIGIIIVISLSTIMLFNIIDKKRKRITTAHLRRLEKKVESGEISYSRMVEILNE